jgi:hypothetical protein
MRWCAFFAGLLLNLGAAAKDMQIPDNFQILAFANELAARGNDFVFCLRVNGSDASAVVISKLQSKNRVVVPGLDCAEVVDVNQGSYQKSTRNKAMFVDLWDFTHPDDSHASIEVRAFHHGLWGGGATLEFARIRNGWVVARRRAGPIS